MPAEALDMFPEVRSHPEADTDVRFTPRWYIAQRHAEQRYTVDAASQADAPSSKIIGRFWSKADNGLLLPWAGERVWCNPPWSDIEPWVKKAWEAMGAGCELVDMLLPVWTDRQWWQKHVEPYRDTIGLYGRGSGETVLVTKFLPRMPFGHPGNPDGVGEGQPPFFCVLLMWRRA